MDYSLYHDESKEFGYWHGILLIPNKKKEDLLLLLDIVRTNTKFKHEIGIKKVKNKKSIITNCAKGFINVGLASLISQHKNQNYDIDLMQTNNGIKVYDKILPNIGAKFILLREKNNLSAISNYPDFGSVIETTFRFALKGGIHFLADVTNNINITKMHFDGHEHYGRNIDKTRIVDRLTNLRDYFTIENRPDLIDDRNSNHSSPNSQNYMDCQFLQLTDLLIGTFRSNLGFHTKPLHKQIGFKTLSLIEKYNQGYARMEKSKWKNSIFLSQCELNNDSWCFESLVTKSNASNNQLKLKL